MTVRLPPSARNPLVRRVLRHRNITTLFRAPITPVEAPDELPAGRPAARDTSITVRAHPVRQRPDMHRRDVDETGETGHAVVSYRSQAETESPAVRRTETPPSASEGAEAAAAQPKPTRPTTARPSDSAPERPPTAQPDPDTTITDDVWQRLTNIFRRHQERDRDEVDRAGERQSEIEPPAASERTGSPAAPPTSPQSRRPDEVASPEASGVETPISSAPEDSPGEAGDAGDLSDETGISTSSPEAPVPVPSHNKQEAPDQASEAIRRRPMPQTEIQRTPAPEVSRTREGTSPEPQDRLLSGPPSEAPGTEAHEAQTVARPDQAWEADTATETEEQGEEAGPQRRSPTRHVSRSITQGHRSTEATVVSDPVRDQPPADRQALPSQESRVAPQQEPAHREPATPAHETPSPSVPRDERSVRRVERATAVENLPEQPRPPLEEVWQVERRPGAPSPPAPPPDVTGETTASTRRIDAPPPPQVQRHLEEVGAGRPTRSSVEVIASRRPRPPAATTVQHVVDRRTGDAVLRPQAPPSDIDMVDTEIGPLPRDLWELIDEPAPHREIAERGPALEGERADRSQPSAPSPPQPSPEPTTSSRPDRIQRVAAPAISGARRETEEEPDFGGAAADLDVEELARRVYAEVKRRLAIEWERLRPQT